MIEKFEHEIDIGHALQLSDEVARLQGRFARLCLDAGDPGADSDDRARAEAERRRVGVALARTSTELALLRAGTRRA